MRISLSPALGPTLLGMAGLLGLLALWWLATVPWVQADSLAHRFSPSASLQALVTMLGDGEIWHHIGVSLKRVLVGLTIAVVVGVPLGLALGWWQGLNDVLSPSMQFLRMISPLSWMPIAVMLFGIGDQPVYFLLGYAAVWPVMLSTLSGVRAVEPRWLDVGQSLAASRWETIRHIVVPAITAHVLTGVRLAVGILWIVLVPCEMLGVTAGLGYYILDTRDRLDYQALMATIVLIGALGFLLDWILRTLCQQRKIST
jgi:NitT/TauT family transport system permease protein